MFTGSITITESTPTSKRTICEVKNVVTSAATSRLNSNNPVFDSNLRIVLSSLAYPSDYSRTSIDNVLRAGEDPPGNAITYYPASGDNPPYLEYHNVFPPPVSRIDFYTVALALGATPGDHEEVTLTTYAYRSLNAVASHELGVTLDIYYRIRIDTSAIANLELQEATQELAFASITSNAYDYCSVSHNYITPAVDHYLKHHDIQITGSLSTTISDNYLKRTIEGTLSLPTNYQVIRSVVFGKRSVNMWAFGVMPLLLTDLPFQSLQSHAVSSDSIFEAQGTPATSTFSPEVGGTWTGSYSKLYWFSVTGSGSFGVGTYTFNVSPYLGILSGYTPNQVRLQWDRESMLRSNLHHPSPLLESEGLYRQLTYFNSGGVISLTAERLAYYDKTGITIVNVTGDVILNFDSSSTPALPVSEITQVAYHSTVYPNRLYVSCLATGIYMIDLLAETVTHLIDDSTHGVDITNRGDVVCLTSTDLQVYSNLVPNLANYNVTLTPQQIDEVNFIKVKPDERSFDYHVIMAAKVDYGTTNVTKTKDKLYWWNNTHGLINTTYTNEDLDTQATTEDTDEGYVDLPKGGKAASHPNAIVYDPIREVWIYLHELSIEFTSAFGPVVKYTLVKENEDPTAITQTVVQPTAAFHTNTDDHRFPITAFNSPVLLLNELGQLVTPFGTYQSDISGSSLSKVYNRGTLDPVLGLQDVVWPKLTIDNLTNVAYLGLGRVLAGNSIIGIYNYSQLPPPLGSYGWDSLSNQWVLNSTTPRPIHGTVESLIDGLSVRWVDSNPGSSVSPSIGEYYTQVLTDGLLLDGSIPQLPLKLTYHLRQRVVGTLDLTVPSTPPFELTVPAITGNILWFSLEPDIKEFYDLYLNGVPIADLIPEGGATPLTNEVKVLNALAGVLEFSGANAGMAVTGTYNYYLKLPGE